MNDNTPQQRYLVRSSDEPADARAEIAGAASPIDAALAYAETALLLGDTAEIMVTDADTGARFAFRIEHAPVRAAAKKETRQRREALHR